VKDEDWNGVRTTEVLNEEDLEFLQEQEPALFRTLEARVGVRVRSRSALTHF